jgi:hypothetical protein
MNTSPLDCSPDEAVEHGFWYRVSSSAILVGAGIGWTSAIIACCVAAPLSLAFAPADEYHSPAYDDL